MLNKSEILASNPNLISYRVMLHEDKGDKFQIAFDCYAEDDDHAAEQAQNAYPNGEVLTITPFCGNENDGDNPAQERKFFKTTYSVAVLSEHTPASGLGLTDIAHESCEGEFSCSVSDDGGIALTPEQCAAALLAQGSCPSFFMLDGVEPAQVTARAPIDWALLRTQKASLVSMAHQDDRLTSEIEVLDGVIALLDHIQDDAVAQHRATALEVFGPDWVIYSANESACSDGAGFWSNASGWTTISGADHFDDIEKQHEHLPLSTGLDAKWVEWAEVEKSYGEFSENELRQAGIDTLSPAIDHLQRSVSP